jgi:cysteine-rich CPXCG protein
VVETVVIHCPYCGEGFETVVDLSAGSQHYTEDCAVCCKPIEISLNVDDEGNL